MRGWKRDKEEGMSRMEGRYTEGERETGRGWKRGTEKGEKLRGTEKGKKELQRRNAVTADGGEIT